MPGSGVEGYEERGPTECDRQLHAAEIARFQIHVVCGPKAFGLRHMARAVGKDGYDRFYLTRDGVGFWVRPYRSASAIAGRRVAAGGLDYMSATTRYA